MCFFIKRISLVLFFVFFTTDVVSQNDLTVNSLSFTGLKKTKPELVEKLINIEEGGKLDSLQIQNDIIRLKRLPAFSNATYEVNYSESGKADVVYAFDENFTIIPGLNIFTTNNGEFAFRASLFEFNLLGENMLFGGYYLRDIFNSYGVFWEAPNIFGRKFGLGLNHVNSVTQEPVFFSTGTINYRYRNNSFEVSLLFQPNFNNRFELGVSYVDEAYDFVDGDLLNVIPKTVEGDKLQYRLEYEFNNVNLEYQNLSGIKSNLNFRIVGESNELLNSFLIARNDFTYYKRIGERGNWASRFRLAIATNGDTPFAPFAVDNNLNIRGVGNTIDRGTAATILNTEYRHTLFEKNWFVLQSNTFIDAGSWRNPGGDLNELFDGNNLRVYPGLGVRFIHKRIFNAVFRLDYGYGITDNGTNGIVFGVGQYF
ncbi:MAG: outer membrane protein assembly factor [Flavobacteriaceae bacterium]|nr:outer membrane protein assembly factor [Flavobacteriaceae bacterium]